MTKKKNKEMHGTKERHLLGDELLISSHNHKATCQKSRLMIFFLQVVVKINRKFTNESNHMI